MKNTILNDITSYIDFLRQCGYAVTLSCFGNRFEPYTAELMKYEVHPHPVCSYLKRNKTTVGKCIRNKHKLEKTDFRNMYYSCCYAGVEEYVVPVVYKDELLTYISVSGYRGSLEKSGQNYLRIAKLCDSAFTQLYSELDADVPSPEDIMSFVSPLQYMLRDLYRYCHNNYGNAENLSATKALYIKVMKYIYENYMHDISCTSIAEEMGYSTSYLRYVFKKEGAGSVSENITDIKLSHALFLLTNTKLNITEISFNCGFCDSNYFSTVFKKQFGMPPKLYRIKYAEKEITSS